MSDASEMYHEMRRRKYEEKTYGNKVDHRDENLIIKLSNENKLAFRDTGFGPDGLVWKILIQGSRGERVVDFNFNTRKWKVRGGKGEGFGAYTMARYFQLIPKKGES